jgi:hypothetical protein
MGCGNKKHGEMPGKGGKAPMKNGGKKKQK